MSPKEALKGPFFHVWLLLFIGLTASVGFMLSGSEPVPTVRWGIDGPGEWLHDAYRWNGNFFLLLLQCMVGVAELLVFALIMDMTKIPRWIHCLSVPLYVYFCWGKDWGQVCFMVVQVNAFWAGGLGLLALLRWRIREAFDFSKPGNVPASMMGTKVR